MAKKTFKGRAILPGKVEGKALVSKQPFNTTASYLENMFMGVTDKAPCTDQDNPELFKKDLANCIMITPSTIGSTMGGPAFMGVIGIGVGPKAMLFTSHIDSVAASGLIMADVWNDNRVITIDMLGEEFLEAVKTGDAISIAEDGTVSVG